MPFDDLDKGDKVDLHLHLKQYHVDLIDDLRKFYNCSRSTAVEALIDEYASKAPVHKRLKEKR